jgi:serine/threonine protein kinase
MVAVLQQFLRNLSESRLLPAGEVASLQKALQGSKTPHSVEEVAKLLVDKGKLTKYQAVMIGQGQPQNLILGEYVLLDILGKGGMGVVFRARHRLMDRIVALKTLTTSAMKPDTVQRFYREVKAAARLSHPNIVTAYDAGEQAGTHYLVMEYVAGRDLGAVIKGKGPLPLREAIDYAQQAARGLDFAHRNGVVHRDVKPSNLLLDQAGVIKILDMGLARVNENLTDVPEAAELTGTGQILGTVDYMSPEQAEDVRSADERSDIYSLGCTLYYMLTRRPVFGGETILKRILCHRDDPVPSVVELRPDCPLSLDVTIQWMLAKRPSERPQNMAEVIVELENCLASPDAAPPQSLQSPQQTNAVGNWLEDLGQEGHSLSTNTARDHDQTLRTPTEEDLSMWPKPGGSSSSIRRSKRQLARSKSRRSPQSAQRRRWKTLAAVTLIVGLVGAGVLAWVKYHSGDHRSSTDDSGGASSKPPESAQDSGKSGEAISPKPNQPVQAPAWEKALADTKTQADRLMAQRQFGNAVHEYTALSGRFLDPPLQQRCAEAIRRTEAEAETAFRPVETAAREHLRQNHFAQARAALRPVLASFGTVPAAARGKKLEEEIDQAEKQALAAEKTAPISHPTAPTLSAELLWQRQLDATFGRETAAAERRVAAWGFHGALQDLKKLRFDSSELKARLAVRTEQVQRLAELKGRMIAAINQADPHLQKTNMLIKGINGEIIKADAETITSVLPNGKDESLAWAELGPKAVHKLVELVVRVGDGSDCLSAGLLVITIADVQGAKQYFEKAESLGTDTSACRALLAAKDFSGVRELLNQHKFVESETRLIAIQGKYGKLSWFAASKPEYDVAVQETKRGLREIAAEAAYAQAAGLFRSGDLYELRPLIERFKTEFAETSVAADSQRKPSVAELEKALADLGPLVRVRKDGTGDSTTIQEAVNGAAANAMIQIEEAGPWIESIVVPADKAALTICGKRGLVATVTTAGAQNRLAGNFLVRSPKLSLERLIITRGEWSGPGGAAVTAGNAEVTFSRVIVHGHVQVGKLDSRLTVFSGGVGALQGVVAKDCLFLGPVNFRQSCSLQNVLASAGGGVDCGHDSQLRHCTIAGQLRLAGTSGTVSDSIILSISAVNQGFKIEHCDVYGNNPFVNQAAPGKGCLRVPPQFVEQNGVSFRLQPASPCRRVASDGSDMGFIYTPEIQAMLKLLGELRSRARGKL